MKRFLIMISAAALISAGCNRSAQKTDDETADSLAKQAVIDSMNTVNQQQKTIDSLKVVAGEKHDYPRHERTEATTSTSSTTTTTAPASTSTTASAPATTTTTTTTQKKGLSTTATGALIGTGVGAITGAIVSKHHKAGGALIGGLIGAGAGAGTGAIIQKKKNQDTLQ